MSSIFPKTGFFISLATLILGILNWAFWFFAVKLETPDEIGIAASVSSVMILFGSLVFFGMEFPMLKSCSKKNEYFGTALIFELIIASAIIPLVIFSSEEIGNNDTINLISVILVISTIITFVSFFSLLGLVQIKKAIIIQLCGAITKLILLVFFSNLDYGVVGMLLAILSHTVITASILTFFAIKQFGVHFNKKALKEIIIEGIINFPSKLFIILQIFGSVAILALFNISNEVIAGFTLSIGIILFISGLPIGFAQMALAVSTKEKIELSSQSSKFGMGITAPFIVALLITPGFILGVYDEVYSEYQDILFILAISLIPFVLTINTITLLNNKKELKKLAFLGLVQSIPFLILAFILVPIMGGIGAAWAITIPSIAGGILSLKWVSKYNRKNYGLFLIVIATSITSGIFLSNLLDDVYLIFLMFVISTFLLFILKLIKISEITLLLGIKKNDEL